MDNQQKGSTKEKHNKNYDRNERAIQRAVFSLIKRHRGRLTACQVAKVAGLSRRTFYRHHSGINAVITESEDRVLAEFSADLDRQVQKLTVIISDANTRLFYATLVFMAHRYRREIFEAIGTDHNNQGILYQMVEIIYPQLEIAWLPKGTPAPALGSERADMLARMIVEVLCKWSTSTHCNVRKADPYIRRMLQATKDAAANRLP